MELREFSRKVCLLGDSAVGKTSLIRRWVYDIFDDLYIVTFGTKVTTKKIEFKKLGERVEVTLTIWDIVGQKEYKRLQAAHYQGANGALLVCDVTRPETLDSLTYWITELQKVVGTVPLIFLANKIDLKDRIRVSPEDLKSFAEKYNSGYMFTSAKSGENVEMAFNHLAELMVK